jgi:penicillin-binding protein 2
MTKKNKIGYAFSEHVFLTKKTFHKERNEDNSNPDILRRLPILILGIVFIVFVLRLLTLQVVRGEYYERLSNENRVRTTLIPAPRGIIFDRNGQALVRNTPAFGRIKDEKIEWFNQEEALKLMEENSNQVLSITQRDYLYKDMFAHVLGYIGQLNREETLQPQFGGYGLSDFTGRMGIEESYEKLLHGENGRQLIEVDVHGNYIRTLGEDFSIAGKNITTTLDLEIQKSVYNAMREVEVGAAVVSDPKTGAILSLFSKPAFDPNLFTRSAGSPRPDSGQAGQAGNDYEPDGGFQSVDEVLNEKTQPLLNRTISGSYPPGSTFKIVTGTAGLEENVINPSTLIEDTGVRTIGGISFGTWNFLQYGKLEKPLNIVGAIRRSNDIFFYVLSERVGVKKISEWAGRFGFGKILNIDIPGEIAGVVPGPSWKERVIGEDWYLGDTYNMSIGQGFVQATPLQTNFMTNVIANGGTLYRPHVVPENKKVIREDFIDKNNLELIRQGMYEACQTGGTGYPFFDFKVKNEKLKVDGLDYVESASASAGTVNVSVGCKTGTSETFDGSAPHAWFTVFAPFHNPEISVTVIVEHGGEGSAVAAPIAKEILSNYFEGKN